MMAQTSQHDTIRTTNSEKRVQLFYQKLLLQQRNAHGLLECELLKHYVKIYAHNILILNRIEIQMRMYYYIGRLLKLSHNYKTPPTFLLPLIFQKISKFLQEIFSN